MNPFDSLTKILRNIPSSVFKKKRGATPYLQTFSLGTGAGLNRDALVYKSQADALHPDPDASNVVKLLGAGAFATDLFFEDIAKAKEETYIGYVPVNLPDIVIGTMSIDHLDDIANPGFFFNLAQDTPFQTITIPPPKNKDRPVYVTITNTGSVPFLMYGLTIDPGTTQTFNFIKGIPTWVPISGVNIVTVPGADWLQPPAGNAVDYLNYVGSSFGAPRFKNEQDTSYKARARAYVVGPKVTPAGVLYQVKTVYPLSDVAIYEWFPSSYTQLLAILTPNYLAFKIPLSGSDGTVIPTTIDTSATQGPEFTFYIVVNNSVLDEFQNGVVADYSFTDAGDPQLDADNYGGFFTDASGDVTAVDLGQNKRIMRIIQDAKAAGTTPILVIQNAA